MANPLGSPFYRLRLNGTARSARSYSTLFNAGVEQGGTPRLLWDNVWAEEPAFDLLAAFPGTHTDRFGVALTLAGQGVGLDSWVMVPGTGIVGTIAAAHTPTRTNYFNISVAQLMSSLGLTFDPLNRLWVVHEWDVARCGRDRPHLADMGTASPDAGRVLAATADRNWSSGRPG